MNVLTPAGYRTVADLSVGDEVCAFEVGTGVPIINMIESIERYTPARFATAEEGPSSLWSLVPPDDFPAELELSLDAPIDPFSYNGKWYQAAGDGQLYWADACSTVVTPPMQFYTFNGVYRMFALESVWISPDTITRAELLQVGDTIYDDENNVVTITSVSVDTGDEWYRFKISGDHSYIADGITLHNASRYWVGGTGAWDASTTTHWAASSGGASGASAPTSVDDVFFDSASNATAYTLTMGTGAVCSNLSIDGPATGAVTWAGSTAMSIYGGMDLIGGAAKITRTLTSTFNWVGTAGPYTINSNGVTFGNSCNIGGIGGSWQLTSAFTTVNVIVTAGDFDTNNQTLTLTNSLQTTGTVTRSITLGSSTVSINGTSAISLIGSGLTFNAGTSVVTLSNGSANVNASIGSITFYDLIFSAFVGGNSFTGVVAVHDLSITVASGSPVFIPNTNLSVSGTFTVSGASSSSRLRVSSSVRGTALTITTAAFSFADVDFQDITAAGAGGTWSGTRLGNLLGNSNITFGAGGTKYWVGGTGNTNDPTNHWATSSGGAPGATNFPLPQDNVVFDAASNATAYTVTFSASTILACTDISFAAPGTSGTITWAGSAILTILGNLSLLSGMSRTFTGAITFGARSTGKTIDSKAVTLASSTTFDGPGGAWTLSDVWNVGGAALTLINGTLTTNSFTVTCATFTSNTATGTRAVDISGSTIALTATWNVSSTLTLTVDTSSAITLSNANGGFIGGALTYNDVTWTNGALTTPSIANVNTFRNLSLAGPFAAATTPVLTLNSSTVAGTLIIGSGNSQVNRPLVHSGTVGTTSTITVATHGTAPTDVDFRDISITGAAGNLTGTRLGDCGGNSGITFTTPKTSYWVGASATWTSNSWSSTSGGAATTADYPLPQDSAIFDTNSFTANSQVVTRVSSARMPAINASGVTHTGITCALANTNDVYGSLVLSANFVFSNGGIQMSSRSNPSITSNGSSFASLVVGAVGSTVTLNDALVCISALSISDGDLNLNGQSVSAQTLNTSSSSRTRGILDSVGGSVLTLTLSSGATIITIGNGTSLTIDTTGWSIVLSANTSSERSINGSNVPASPITLPATSVTNTTTGTSTLRINSGGVSFDSLAFSNLPQTLSFTAGTIIGFGAPSGFPSGASGTLVTVRCSTPGSTYTLTRLGAVPIGADYLSISDAIGDPTATWYAGTHSTDGGNNTDITFTDPPTGGSHATTGSLVADAGAIVGTAVHPHTTTGSLVADAGAIVGTAVHLTLHATTGSLVADAAAIVGTAVHPHTTTGSLVADAAAIVGTAVHPHTTTGSLVADAAAIVGTAVHLTLHATTGSLVADAGAIVGTAVRTHIHATSGVLVASTASVSGVAILGNVHATSGILAAANPTIVGSAERTHIHAATGVLVSTSSVIAGTSSHLSTHDSNGALAGAESTVNATAAHLTTHIAAGILEGSGSIIVGLSAHNVLHNSTGVLDGNGAIIAGTASRRSAYIPDPYRTWNIPAEDRVFVVSAENRIWRIDP